MTKGLVECNWKSVPKGERERCVKSTAVSNNRTQLYGDKEKRQPGKKVSLLPDKEGWNGSPHWLGKCGIWSVIMGRGRQISREGKKGANVVIDF